VDASFLDNRIIAFACLYKYPELYPLEDSIFFGESSFPYIPGMLSFREGPAIISAIKKLSQIPDLIIFDGHGIAHPKGFGIASHIGVILDIATIGCAKSCLVGEYVDPGLRKGQWQYLYYKGKEVGVVLRTRDFVKPIFVSPGHKIDIKSSIDIVLNCVLRYRIPEPLRRADRLSKIYKKEDALWIQRKD
jgi:deoxyribonuclease V